MSSVTKTSMNVRPVVNLERVTDKLGHDGAGASPCPDRPSSRSSFVLKHDLAVQLLVYKWTFLQ